MKVTFLGQGFEADSEDSVGKMLIKFFADSSFHTFTCISAFTSQGGANGLSRQIANTKIHLNNISIVTGVDMKGTSQEALKALLNLNVNAFVFYQPSSTIFHPKIYLFEGAAKSELIIGSSNLTPSGLFTNVEASILVSMDNSVEEDRKVVRQLKEYFKGIFDFTDPNLARLTIEVINELVKKKIVPTEAERKAAYDKAEKVKREDIGGIIAKIFPKRAIAKVPAEFWAKVKPKNKTEKANSGAVIGKEFTKSELGALLWTSGALTERDLNIPEAANTNPTGSMLFKKGELHDIDQRNYFREKVFSALKWTKDPRPSVSHLERANAIFRIGVDGKDFGNFTLKLSHNTKTYGRSYEQHQPMTNLSWGDAKKVIADKKLIGKSAFLYKSKGKKDEFILIIK